MPDFEKMEKFHEIIEVPSEVTKEFGLSVNIKKLKFWSKYSIFHAINKLMVFIWLVIVSNIYHTPIQMFNLSFDIPTKLFLDIIICEALISPSLLALELFIWSRFVIFLRKCKRSNQLTDDKQLDEIKLIVVNPECNQNVMESIVNGINTQSSFHCLPVDMTSVLLYKCILHDIFMHQYEILKSPPIIQAFELSFVLDLIWIIIYSIISIIIGSIAIVKKCDCRLPLKKICIDILKLTELHGFWVISGIFVIKIYQYRLESV